MKPMNKGRYTNGKKANFDVFENTDGTNNKKTSRYIKNAWYLIRSEQAKKNPIKINAIFG